MHRWRKPELALVDIVFFLSAATNWSRVPTQRWLISQCWSCFKLYVIASRTTYVLHVCVRLCVCVCFIFVKSISCLTLWVNLLSICVKSEEYKKTRFEWRREQLVNCMLGLFPERVGDGWSVGDTPWAPVLQRRRRVRVSLPGVWSRRSGLMTIADWCSAYVISGCATYLSYM